MLSNCTPFVSELAPLQLGEQYADDAAAEGSKPKGVFTGVSIFVNGLTNPSWMELKHIMIEHGGKFQNYYSRASVTHIVCAHLTDAKLEQLRHADRNHPPVVKPEWVTASLDAGTLQPVADFALERTLEPGER